MAPPVVVDADVLYRNLDYAVVRGYDGSLFAHAQQEIAQFSGVRLFAATEVREEVLRHMPDIAERRAVDLDTVERVWEERLAPCIRFVAVRPDAVDDPRLEGVDPKDLPSARLAVLLADSLLLTGNRKHYKPFALPESLSASLDLHKVAEFRMGATGVSVVPLTVGAITIDGAKKVTDKVGKTAALVIFAVMIGGAIYLLNTERGRNLRAELSDMAQQAAPVVGDYVAAASDAYQRISGFTIEREAEIDALSLIASRLAVDAPLMTTIQIDDHLRTNGFRYKGPKASRIQTRAWLTREPCFVEVARGRWVLGA